MNRATVDQESADQKKRGVLLVLTGPTGSGKDTLFQKLQEHDPLIIKIITTTSRQPREQESEGNPYNFLNREDFERKIVEDAFFEWVEFRGELYGTQKKTLMDALEKGVDVIWRIEAKGVKNIKQKVKQMVDRSVFVFLTAPVEILKNRVMKDEGDQKFTTRWNESLVLWEREQYDDCDYLVFNQQDNLKEAVKQVLSIIEAKRIEIKKLPLEPQSSL